MSIGGHDVASEKIEERYYKSLQLLPLIIPHTAETYLYDNSGERARLFVRIEKGIDITRLDETAYPQWYIKYVIGSGLKLYTQSK